MDNREDFLKQEVENVNFEIIKLLEKEYANTGLEEEISECRMIILRGYMFTRDYLDTELRNEIEGED